MNYDMPQAEQGGYALSGALNQKMARMPTLRERLDLAVAQAEERLAAVKEAREIFDRNPDVEKLLDLMQRAHF